MSKKRTPAKPAPKPLTPVDLQRCQAERSNGVTFMTMGGKRAMVRCDATPTMIATERRPGDDGRQGSMSLCDACCDVLQEQQPGFTTVRRIAAAACIVTRPVRRA